MAQLASDNRKLGAPTKPDESEDAEDAEDEELDGESLLYKLMQQQSFLLSPVWGADGRQQVARQHQTRLGNSNKLERQVENLQNELQTGGRTQVRNNNNLQQQQQQQQQVGNERHLANSKKVIKLLKSYSHIHQVDDSDDQIRGTYTRMASLQRPQQLSR